MAIVNTVGNPVNPQNPDYRGNPVNQVNPVNPVNPVNSSGPNYPVNPSNQVNPDNSGLASNQVNTGNQFNYHTLGDVVVAIKDLDNEITAFRNSSGTLPQANLTAFNVIHAKIKALAQWAEVTPASRARY